MLASGRTGNFSILNLSTSGALLVGDVALAASTDGIKLLLHVDGYRSFGVGAEVLRATNVSSDRHEIRYSTDDTRSEEQAKADDRIGDEVEHTGGVWAQMTAEQRAQLLARLRDKKQRAQASCSQTAEQETLEHRVAKLEERLARLGG